MILAALAAWLYHRHQQRHRPPVRATRPVRGNGEAGASAAARARELRTPGVQLATSLGIPTQRAALADRSDAGAEGERRTAARIDPLRQEGWTILHDRALPPGRANLDHLAISPSGVVILADTKRWSARNCYRVRVVNGRLLHGGLDVTTRLGGLLHEARTVSTVLGTPVVPLIVMDGPPVEGGELTLHGIRIVPADRACTVIRDMGRHATTKVPPQLAARAARLFPPYPEATR
nr:nuclease-related domain-containing protein [Streptomyces sp. SID11385]